MRGAGGLIGGEICALSDTAEKNLIFVATYVGEYCGLAGEYFGEVAPGEVGLNCGDVGE